MVRIADPTSEDDAIRAAAQALIDDCNAGHSPEMPDIETRATRSSQPRWAARTDGPQALAAYYRERYTKDGLLGFNENGSRDLLRTHRRLPAW